MDDIFDEESDDVDIERKEWERLCNARIKEGFRDGVSHGQESMLQKGFNDGFTETTSIFHSLSRLRGYLCGMIGCDQLQQTSQLPPPLITKLKALVQKLSDLERSWFKTLECPREIPPVSVQTEHKPQTAMKGETEHGKTESMVPVAKDVQSEDNEPAASHSTDVGTQLDLKQMQLDCFKKEIKQVFTEYDILCTFLDLT